MIPRFSNPHFLLQSTKVITRADLDVENEENSKDCLKEESKNIEQLHRLLGNSLPKWDVPDIRANKRRKIEENDQEAEEPVRMCSLLFFVLTNSNLCIVFRLISSRLPALPVSLLPPPPPLLMCVIPSMCLCITITHFYLELENLMQKITNYKLIVGESKQKLLLSMLKTFCQESDRRRYIVLLDASWTR